MLELFALFYLLARLTRETYFSTLHKFNKTIHPCKIRGASVAIANFFVTSNTVSIKQNNSQSSLISLSLSKIFINILHLYSTFSWAFYTLDKGSLL